MYDRNLVLLMCFAVPEGQWWAALKSWLEPHFCPQEMMLTC